MNDSHPAIPGYTYGDPSAARSTVSLEELREVESALGWTEEDAEVLRRHAELFRRCAGPMVDSWRAAIGRQEHLAKWFFAPDGTPDNEYKARIRERFVQWVVDACLRPHDREWLDYQQEIGLRHTPLKKNTTDGARTPSLVPLRYLIAFGSVTAIATRSFFVESGITGDELTKLEDAWAKTVQLHLTFWARPYAIDGWW